MGTNYYVEDQHIGKRSAAGPYCWDWGVTLCAEGNKGIHDGYSEWLELCPICKKSAVEEDLGLSSAGRELGFNKTPLAKKTGVKSCSSFTWAVYPSRWKNLVKQSWTGFIEDEYGKIFDVEEFQAVLDECPIQFEDSIGQDFS